MTTAELLTLVVAALTGATNVGDRVYTARTWNTFPKEYPLIYLKPPKESKESLGRQGAAQFNTTATFTIEARHKVPSQPDGLSAAVLQDALATLGEQIQVAVVNNPSLRKNIQQVAFIETDMQLSDEGAQEQGEMQVSIGLEFYQGVEDFFISPFTEIDSVSITADLISPYDPSGTYADTAFPDAATTAPRTSGPDGRAEGGLTLTLNSET